MKNAIWVLKNAGFDADFESVEEVAKNSIEKNVSVERGHKFFLLFLALLNNFKAKHGRNDTKKLKTYFRNVS